MTVTAHDYDASGKPVCAWDDPDAKAALVSGLVNDARAIISALDGIDLDDTQADAVGLLALVAGQDVEPGDDDGTWRIARQVAPDRVISTVDPESRHMHKSRSVYRDGYKAHIAVEPDTGLITATALTPANAGDDPTGIELLDGEEPGLQVLTDSAYGSGDVRTALNQARHDAAIKAIPLRRNPKLRTGPVQPRRLRHRPQRPHRHLPRRHHRPDRRQGRSNIRGQVPRLPAALTMHLSGRWPNPAHPRP